MRANLILPPETWRRARQLAGLVLAVTLARPVLAQSPDNLRPPAVPLAVSDPMLSIWSEADHLTDDATRHWTHREQPLVSLLRVDGRTFRLMGNSPAAAPALPQTGLLLTPTRSIYDFEGAGLHVTLTFMTPSLPEDLDVLTRPVTYLTWAVRAIDGAEHAVEIYDSTSSQLAVNKPGEAVGWSRETMGPLTALRVGTAEQNLLGVSGDDARINWGYAYAVASSAEARAAAGADDALTGGFVHNGTLPADDDTRMPRATNDAQPVLAFVFDLGKVNANPAARHLMIGYDEIEMIRFFGKPLKPYWSRHGMTPAQLFQAAERDYPTLTTRCEAFDAALIADAVQAGGKDYGQICALAYRQCLAGHGIAADPSGAPLMFTKENGSDGDIATADVIFPAGPELLLVSPTLAKASLAPLLIYAASQRWNFPNAPHDLGFYPVARGTDHGGEQMPVEESGNLIILCDAISQIEGSTDFVDQWWPQLTQWTAYLVQFGLDPENQLSTDDFMGHLAHNANLSIKAILALAAYGDMCRLKGDTENAQKYTKLAREDAEHWVKVADAGDHSLLAFDKPGTWSQKYNLVWDRILKLNVFPAEVAAKEVAYYKSMLRRYGLPLDSRTRITKTDWTLWSATLADKQEDFEALIAPIVEYLNHTTTRLPFVDSYKTHKVHSDGMRARPVIGGVFIKMIADRALWTKWASLDKAKTGNWTPLPPKPTITEVIPAPATEPQRGCYTVDKPPEGWTATGFDDQSWKQGTGASGKDAPHRKDSKSTDLWVRKTWTIPDGPFRHLEFNLAHGEDLEVYVDGVQAAKEPDDLHGYDLFEIKPEALVLLKPGAKVTVAAHCHQPEKGKGIDMGLVDVVTP